MGLLLIATILIASGCGDDTPPMMMGDTGVGEGGTGGLCGVGDFAEPTITRCAELTPTGDGSCTTTAGDSRVLLVGDVLTPGEVFAGGQVLIGSSGSIECVGCDCAAEGATRVECPQGVISPGLINAHDHITFDHGEPFEATDERYEHRHDWRKGLRGHSRISSAGPFSSNEQRSWAELRTVMSGATSVNGSGGPSGFLRNVDTTRQEGLGQSPVEYSTFIFGDGSDGNLRDGDCMYPDQPRQSEIAGLDAFTPHVAEGIDREARNEFLCIRDGDNDLVEDQSAFIHGVGLLPNDIGEMALDGAALIWSPRTNIALYGDTARVTEYARLGVPIAIGTDWIISGSMNMSRELQCAESFNDVYLDGFFTSEQLWLMATRNGAEALALDDVVGTLSEGMVADIAIFDGSVHADHAAVIRAEPAGVMLVLRGGQPLYGDANIVSALPGGDQCDALDVCGRAKEVCVSREVDGATLTTLQQANNDAYPLFFCGEPTGEPTCVPARDGSGAFPSPVVDGSNRYSGMIQATDGDGDGIADAEDNCPCVFNPIRPMDEGMQADFDRDGAGDACDVCPLDANTSTCTGVNPDDRDNDGVLDADDNCPGLTNADQADRDMDGKGDACDACPDTPNPDSMACPASIYTIKRGEIMEGEAVAISGSIVTAVADNGFFMQVSPSDAAYSGIDHSGIFVFTNDAPTVSRGDQVDIVRATIGNFFGQKQLISPSITVVASGQALPPVEVVSAAEVATGGARAITLEGTLIRVMDARVIDDAPPPGEGDRAPTGEFLIEGGLRVNDYLFAITPFPVVGERFSSLTGILAYRNMNTKIEPRDAMDVEAGDPALVGFNLERSFLRTTTTGAPTIPEALEVVLTRPVSAPTFVAISSSSPSLTVSGGGVTIAAGQSRATVLATGGFNATPVMLTASLDGIEATAEVRVLALNEPPMGITLNPAAPAVTPSGSVIVRAELDIPAPPSGTAITLSLTPAALGSIPLRVVVPGDALSAEFTFTAGAMEGTVEIRGTFAGLVATASLSISAAGSLVINEVDYDTPGTDTMEFIELHNPAGGPQDLTGLAVILINGSGNSEYARYPLSGTLAPGGYLVIGSPSITLPPGTMRIDLPNNGVQNGAPDGIVLYDRTEGSVVDALSYEGEITAGMIDGGGMVNLVEGTALPTSVSDQNSGTISLIRWPNGSDTDNAATDWRTSTTPTPGAANVE